MPPALIGRVAEAADRLFGLLPGAEVTIEANPNDVSAASVAGWRAAGVTRVSLGVQSFDDAQLAFLGRDHDGGSARRAVDAVLDGFERSTFDLIYALPGEGVEAWTERLTGALATGARHLSLYQLTVEPGTAFARAVERGAWSPVPEALDAALYEATQEVAGAGGLPAYEVSNHAAPGHEAVHNALYWQGADWLAIGPGAHGRVTTEGERIATEGARAIGAYLNRTPTERLSEEVLDEESVLTERVAGALRTRAGLDLGGLGSKANDLCAAAQPLIDEGLLAARDGALCATQAGRLVLDALTAELLRGV